MDFPKQYIPKNFETDIAASWEKADCFSPQPSRTGQTFYIPIPPPNVTGNLHIGHALTLTLEDIMVRYHRMKGDSTLWVPGTDHAGIATQAKVEERILKSGQNRKDMGREKFLDECWKWMHEYQGNIRNQFRKMGASVDWSKERFTLDAGLSNTVQDTFIRMYQDGLIYRGEYMVNYSPALESVISDIEVDHIEIEEKMYYINYFVAGTDNELMIATTRPETLLADMAVAVNPKDKRYKKMIGRTVLLPIINREIPIIGDETVDINFGTGVVKITPAHDPNDFEMAKRHNLRCDYTVIDKNGNMNAEAGTFAGQVAATEARGNIVELLKSKGNLVRTEPYVHTVGFCSRGNCRIESVVSTQWFVRAGKMAEKVIAGYEKKEFDIIPERYNKVFEDWIYNLRDWCISRQLWWGHQIPAYYDILSGELLYVGDDLVDTIQSQCSIYSLQYTPHTTGSIYSTEYLDAYHIRRDSDVLDTWFSSAMWPFSVLDWSPDTASELFRQYYPANVLETGHDILFFWVIRMLLMGYTHTGQTPFRTIYLHGLVLDEKGKKMSKSWGNVVDPLDIISTYSADALRMTTSIGNTAGNNLNFNTKTVEEYSLFLNKLWNIARFVWMHTGDIVAVDTDIVEHIQKNKKHLLPYERWILSRLHHTISTVTEGMDTYDFSSVGTDLIAFIRDDFADMAIESYKIEKENSKLGKEVLSYTLLCILKMLHPYIPFITEALYTSVSGGQNSTHLMTTYWPVCSGKRDILEEKKMNEVYAIVRTVRSIRASSGIRPSDMCDIYLHTPQIFAHILEENLSLICGLSRGKNITMGKPSTDIDTYLYGISGNVEIYIENTLQNEDMSAEIARIQIEIDTKKQYIRTLDAKLLSETFISRAPEAVVRGEMEKRKTASEQIVKLEEKIGKMGG